jgi:Spy/CpxP family protein refolding chaperone
MKMRTALFAAAAVLIPATAFAQAPARSQNLEPACNATGSGMDPRCVGDTTPGTVTDMTTSREQRALQNGVPPAAVAVPAEREVIIERR